MRNAGNSNKAAPRPTVRPSAPTPVSSAAHVVHPTLQLKPANNSKSETRLAPPVYRPQLAVDHTMQLKPTSDLRVETRPGPPVYRPQPGGVSVTQTKPPMVPQRGAVASPVPIQPAGLSLQPQAQYELSSPLWIGNGRQQIRVMAKGSPTPIGSVDVHYSQKGEAYISDLEVSQGHRRHGVGTMLMKAAMDAARRSGRSATELEARPGPGSISNQALLGMYQKLGFRNAGTSSRGNPRMSAKGAVQQKAALPDPFGPATRHLPHRFTGIIQRMDVDEESKEEEVGGEDAARILVKYIFGKKGTDDNWTVGVLTNGDLMIGKVNGVTSGTSFTVDLGNFIKLKKIEKGRDIYLAKVFHNGSSRHAEMCVLAAADALSTGVSFMICVAPNCDFCAQMLSDAGVPSAHHQGTNPTSQQGWTHPRKKVAYGTQLTAPLKEQLAELKALNSGRVGEDDVTKGSKQGVAPQGQSEKWL
jgi:GNAT superfamily N-acetyltransferase